eukprot:g29396.t1
MLMAEVGRFLTEWHAALQTNGDYPPSLDYLGSAQNRQVHTLVMKITQHLSSCLYNEDLLELFFKFGCDFTVREAERRAEEAGINQADSRENRLVPIDFGQVDSFCFLITALMKNPREIDRPFAYNQQALPVLKSALQAVHKALARAAVEREKDFNQRIWYRLLLNIMLDAVGTNQEMNWKILQALADTFLDQHSASSALNPTRVPNFAFAWLDLINHKQFMPRILSFPGRRGWLLFQRIFMGLLHYIGPYLARIRMSDLIRNLYKCTLRTLLVLLYDFPEFLSDYHMAFCDAIPWQCVQFRCVANGSRRGLSMKLPDPFTHCLKVDTLPEMKVTPTIQSTYLLKLMTCGLKADVDNWIKTSDWWARHRWPLAWSLDVRDIPSVFGVNLKKHDSCVAI